MLSLGKPELTQWNMRTRLYLLQPVSSDWSPQSSTSSHARCCEMHFLLLHLNSSSAQGLGVGPTPVIEEQIKVKTFSSVKQEASLCGRDSGCSPISSCFPTFPSLPCNYVRTMWLTLVNRFWVGSDMCHPGLKQLKAHVPHPQPLWKAICLRWPLNRNIIWFWLHTQEASNEDTDVGGRRDGDLGSAMAKH